VFSRSVLKSGAYAARCSIVRLGASSGDRRSRRPERAHPHMLGYVPWPTTGMARGSWISGAQFSRIANKIEHRCIPQENNHVWCVLEKMFFKFLEELLMSNALRRGANEARAVATPTPQQNQGDKPAPKSFEQQK
jgi:hypothetical protein